MSNSPLPERLSLEFLKKHAKERLRELRRADPRLKLADVQLSVARDYGFTSWRALKMQVEASQIDRTKPFFRACAIGDTAELRRLLVGQPDLIYRSDPAAAHGGWTALHTAARNGHLAAVRLLLERGANPNAREAGDNTYPLHWAAANRHLEVARTLLDAGGDVHGVGDVHELDAIGWATVFHPDGGEAGDQPEVADLLVHRGAGHHIFSAIALGDLEAIRDLVNSNPKALERRLSRFEAGLPPLHFAITHKRYDILDLLIGLKSALEAIDAQGHTAREFALLNGDKKSAKQLRAAGAKEPLRLRAVAVRHKLRNLAASVAKCVPMLYVPDVGAALDWYLSIGFIEISRYADGPLVNFGMLRFGSAELMLSLRETVGEAQASLWLYTGRVDDIYQMLKARNPGINFAEHLNDTFYGARQFGIRDLNGCTLYFIQPLDA